MDWQPNEPASEEEIQMLVESAPFALPVEYLNILRRCNGGEGEFALAPMWLQLWDITTIIEYSKDEFYSEEFPGFWFIGSNGGLESIAFRYSDGTLVDIVMVDAIAGPESAEAFVGNFVEFEKAIGMPAGDH